MLSLYSEVIACIVAAALLGLLCGWMIQRGRANRRLNGTIAAWEDKYAMLEKSTRQDVENLEDQLQNLGEEVKALHRTNGTLSDSLKKSESVVNKARADAIELNRQQAETQERLQRIIQQKDQEIVELGSHSGSQNRAGKQLREAAIRTGVAASVTARVASAQEADAQSKARANQEIDERLQLLQEKTQRLTQEHQAILEATDENADTIAMSPADLETLDETVRLDPMSAGSGAGPARSASDNEELFESTLENTAESNDSTLDMEESTIALDDEAMRFARTPHPKFGSANRSASGGSAPGSAPGPIDRKARYSDPLRPEPHTGRNRTDSDPDAD